MTIEEIVKKAFDVLGGPHDGVEVFLGNDRNPLVAILGFNPGLNGALHPVGAPRTEAEMASALEYYRGYLRGKRWASNEFRQVWSRYCWMLSPGQKSYPRTEQAFQALAPEQLLVLNLYQSQTKSVKAMTAEQKKAKGDIAFELLRLARPKVLVVQGADAWRWVVAQTTPVAGEHLSKKLGEIYPAHPMGQVGYAAAFKWDRNLAVGVLPVFHLTGDEHFRSKDLWFAALESRYRSELNSLWNRLS